MRLSIKRKNGVFAAILVTCIVCSLLSTALTTALPQIMADFGVSTTTGQWLTSIYALVMGIMVLTTPFLIKRFPTKPLYLASLVVFTLGLLCCAGTESFSVMLAGRVLQAAGNGIMVSLGQVILLTIYPKESRGAVMGIYGLALGAAPVLAPTLAGLVVDAFGWRMIFYGSVVISALACLLSAVTFDNVLEVGRAKFDYLSLVLCSVGFCGILFGIGNLGKYSFLSVSVLLPLCFGLAGTGIFGYRQLHMEEPFLELRILKVPVYRSALIASMLMYASMMAASILLPIHIQSVLGYTATVSGLVTMPGSLAMAFVSPFSGKLYDRMGIQKVFLPGAVLLMGSSLGMVFIGLRTPLWLIAGLNVLRNIAIGCMMMPFVTWGMSGLTENQTAHGTALLTSLRTIAGSLGSALFVAVVEVVGEASSRIAGMRTAFAGLAVIGGVEVVLALFTFRRKNLLSRADTETV